MRIIAILLFASLFISTTCTNRQNIAAQLKGHWHIENEHYNSTLDIDDSVATFNKYSLLSFPERFNLFDSASHQPVLPFNCGCGGGVYPEFSKFQIKGDTLIFDEEDLDICYVFSPLKFIRGNPVACYKSHYFSGETKILQLNRFPDASEKVVNYDSLINKYNVSHVKVGFSTYPEDGVNPKIQVHDVFIEKQTIQKFIEEELFYYESIAICFVIDDSVPKEFIKSILPEFRNKRIEGIYHLVSYDGTKLGYQQMK